MSTIRADIVTVMAALATSISGSSDATAIAAWGADLAALLSTAETLGVVLPGDLTYEAIAAYGVPVLIENITTTAERISTSEDNLDQLITELKAAADALS